MKGSVAKSGLSAVHWSSALKLLKVPSVSNVIKAYLLPNSHRELTPDWLAICSGPQILHWIGEVMQWTTALITFHSNNYHNNKRMPDTTIYLPVQLTCSRSTQWHTNCRYATASGVVLVEQCACLCSTSACSGCPGGCTKTSMGRLLQWCCSSNGLQLLLVGIWSAHTKWDNLASETMDQMFCKDNPQI